MNKKLAAPNIDFADSQFHSFQLDNETLIIYISSWNERTLRLTFSNVIHLSYQPADFIKDLYEESEDSPILKNALLNKYGKLIENHPFKSFQIEDIDDCLFIGVVAESVQVVKEENTLPFRDKHFF